MKLPKYQLRSGEGLLSYLFISEGPKGIIQKEIQFTLINRENVYNLAFGDKDSSNGEINDMSISNNGDSEKVLATVVAAVYAFFDRYPEAWVFVSGSTSSRTRLYRMGISKYFDEVKDDFEIYGEYDEQWHPFERNREYTAFLAQRKIAKFGI